MSFHPPLVEKSFPKEGIKETVKAPPTPSKTEEPEPKPLDTIVLSQEWKIEKVPISALDCGLHNLGNSCFMNSTLQILLHTAPLLNVLLSHRHDSCKLALDGSYCFTCQLRKLALDILCRKSRQARSPEDIFRNLKRISPTLRQYRQEDAHEFLRFSIDALQLSAQNGVKSVPEKLAATSWVYRLFGGQFRSRVTCGSCGHNSDTFDTLLDLSVDIAKCDTLKQALRMFSAIERLEGSNKYKCEKCKKPVNAKKQITVHKAPMALCIQLKRFSPWGRKITNMIDYPETLSLNEILSDNQTSPMYQLYGVIVHAGSGPNSGHYYTFVKNYAGKWLRINDDEVDTIPRAPLGSKNAYMLFYMRRPFNINDVVASTSSQKSAEKLSNSDNRKRKAEDMEEDEDVGETVSRPPLSSPMNSSAASTPGPSSAKKPRNETYESFKSKLIQPQRHVKPVIKTTLKLVPPKALPKKPLDLPGVDNSDGTDESISSPDASPTRHDQPSNSPRTPTVEHILPRAHSEEEKVTSIFLTPKSRITTPPWSIPDASQSSPRPESIPPSSGASKAQTENESDDGSYTAPTWSQKSQQTIEVRDVRPHNPKKQYHSKNRRERGRNPFGQIGMPKGRRPGGI